MRAGKSELEIARIVKRSKAANFREKNEIKLNDLKKNAFHKTE